MGLIMAAKRPVTVMSTTLADLGSTSAVGDIRIEPNGKIYKLVKAGEIIGDGRMCVADAGTAAGEITVKVAGANALGIGMNSTGASTANGTYFWMQVAGVASCVSSAAFSIAAALGCAASGNLATLVIGTHAKGVATALEAATAGSQRKNVLLNCL